MLYCPTCGNGYEDQETCPNCEEQLVPRFDQGQMQSPLALIESDVPPEYAHMMNDLLIQNEIYCIFNKSSFDEGGMKWSGLSLLVPEVKVQEAKELIAAFFKEQNIEGAQKVCPVCGQMMPDYKIICPNCGKTIED